MHYARRAFITEGVGERDIGLSNLLDMAAGGYEKLHGRSRYRVSAAAT